MPPFLIPILIHLATKLADLAFQKLSTMSPEKQKPVIKKIESNYEKAKELSKIKNTTGDDTYVA